MTSEVEKKLWKYFFPILEQRVFFENSKNSVLETQKYKSIIREDTNELISIMKDSYKVVTNSEIIKPLMEELNNLETNWCIDDSHSFCTLSRMRLQITLPDIMIAEDDESKTALSLFISNSYSGEEGIRMIYGGLRLICSNGLILGKVLAKFYARHTKNVQVSNIRDQIEQVYSQIPVIRERIEILQNICVSKQLMESIQQEFGKTAYNYIAEQPAPENQYLLMHYLTYFISHMVEKRMRAQYQMKVSRMFSL